MESGGGLTWRPRWSDSSWFVAVAAGIAALAGAIGQWPVPSWALLAVSIAAVALGTAVQVIKAGQGARDTRRGLTEATARFLTPKGELPLVKDVETTAFGVNPARVSVEYLDRQAQGALMRLLSDCVPTLLLGDSLAGKTRMAAEIVSRHYSDWHVWLPQVPAGPAAFFAVHEARLERTVVFLDELQRFLAPGQVFDAEWLDRLAGSGNRVVAMMRSSEYENFLPRGEAKHEHWDVLQRFEKIWLADQDAERAELAAQIDDARTREGVARYGLGQYIGGADIALERLHAGEATHRLGIAMLKAAADWRRIGRGAIARETLGSLAPGYLRDMDRDDPGEDEAAALAWATGRAGPIRLLEPYGLAYRVMDYLQDHLERIGPAVPDATWDAAIAVDDDDQVFEVAMRADRLGRTDLARLLLTRQAPRNPDAAVMLGLMLTRLREQEAAQAAFRDAMARRLGEPYHSVAKYLLAREALPDGDPEAIVLLTEAVESGVPSVISGAAYILGKELERAARFTEAVAAYRTAINVGRDRRDLQTDELADAYVGLGRVLERQEDHDGAETAWRQAIALGSEPEGRSRAEEARLLLGILIIDTGEREAGKEMLRDLMAVGSPLRAQEADTKLGLVSLDEGNFRDAEARFRRGLASEFPDKVAEAEHNLAAVYIQEEDWERAKPALCRVIETGAPKYKARAENNLGVLLMREGNFEEAGALFQSAAWGPDAKEAAKAEHNLADVYTRAEDWERARAALRRVIDRDDPRYAANAANVLGQFLKDDGVLDEASVLFRSALNSGDTEQAARAELFLAEVSQERGDADEAEQVFRRIIDKGATQYAQAIAYSELGGLLADCGRTPEAEELAAAAIGSGNAHAAAMGRVLLGYLLTQQGNLDDALAAYAEVVESGFSDAAGLAHNNIGVIMGQRGDLAAAAEAYRAAIASGHRAAIRTATPNLEEVVAHLGQAKRPG